MYVHESAQFEEQTVDLPLEFVSSKIGVVTITYCSGEVLPDFFRSLNEQTYRDFVLIAIDNQSTDTTLEQLRAYSGSELLMIANDRNLGVAAGNNQGIRAAIEAGCEYVLLLNNDVCFGPNLFQQLVDGLTTYTCDMTTPLIYYHDRQDLIWCAGGSFQRWASMRIRHRGEGVVDQGQFSEPVPVTYAPTCCILFRREVFAAVGLMDEAYFVYMDDVDFLYRAWQRRLLLYYLPEAKLWHKVSSLTGFESPFSVRYTTRNRAYFTAKHLKGLAYLVASVGYLGWYHLQRFRGADHAPMLRRKLDHWNEGLLLAKTIATKSLQAR